MSQDAKAQIDKVMNRLRAQLFNTIEQMGLDDAQCKAYKQTIRDITSDAWNSVTTIIEDLEKLEE